MFRGFHVLEQWAFRFVELSLSGVSEADSTSYEFGLSALGQRLS